MLHLHTTGFSQAAAGLHRTGSTARAPVRCCAATAAAQTAPEASTSAPSLPATERRCGALLLLKTQIGASQPRYTAAEVACLLYVPSGSVCCQVCSRQAASTWVTTWVPSRTGSSCRKTMVGLLSCAQPVLSSCQQQQQGKLGARQVLLPFPHQPAQELLTSSSSSVCVCLLTEQNCVGVCALLQTPFTVWWTCTQSLRPMTQWSCGQPHAAWQQHTWQRASTLTRCVAVCPWTSPAASAAATGTAASTHALVNVYAGMPHLPAACQSSGEECVD